MTTSVHDPRPALSIRIPAKAMLFGEYGVLHGGPALVATLAQPYFELRAELVPAGEHDVALEFFSGYFQQPLAFDDQARQLCGDLGAAAEFIQRCLAALSKDMTVWSEAGLSLRIKITKSFPSELGLGSSSAIIVGLVWLAHWARCQVVLAARAARTATLPTERKDLSDLADVSLPTQKRTFAEAWPDLRSCLAAAQGKGSGYDLAVQYSALAMAQNGSRSSPGLWCFQHLAGLADVASGSVTTGSVPKVERLENDRFWKMAGFLLPSGAAAATGAILHSLAGGAALARFAQQHADIAREAVSRVRDEKLWVESTGNHPLADLLVSALAVARQQGIAGHVEGMAALSLLPPGTVYKTMGAGFGDCLWCLTPGFDACVSCPPLKQENSDNGSPSDLPIEAIPLVVGSLSL